MKIHSTHVQRWRSLALAGALVAPRKITNNGHRASAALNLDILGLTQRARRTKANRLTRY